MTMNRFDRLNVEICGGSNNRDTIDCHISLQEKKEMMMMMMKRGEREESCPNYGTINIPSLLSPSFSLLEIVAHL